MQFILFQVGEIFTVRVEPNFPSSRSQRPLFFLSYSVPPFLHDKFTSLHPVQKHLSNMHSLPKRLLMNSNKNVVHLLLPI